MTPDHNIRENLKQARTAFKAENLEEAEKQARFIIDLDPHHENALKLLARIYNRQARWSQAFTCWHALCKIKADNDEYFFQAGRSATRLDNHSQAVKFLKKTIELKGDHESALTLLAKTYQKQGQWHLAFETWKALGEATNDLSSQLDNLIKTASRQQESPFQANAFEVILTLEPNNRTILQKLVSLYQKQENQIEAARILDQLLKNDEQNLDLLQQRLKIATKLENHDDIYRFRKCLCALTPFDEEEWVKLAQNAKNINSADQHAIWQKILTHRKENEQALRGLAHFHHKKKNWVQSASLWKEICAIDPSDESAWVHYARALQMSRNPDLDHVWQDIHQRFPQNREALRHCAKHATLAQDWNKVEDIWFQLAHMENPSIHDCRKWARSCEKNNTEHAYQAWQQFLSVKPDDIEALKFLARYAMEQEDWISASRYWKEIHHLLPDDDTALISWARTTTRFDTKKAAPIWTQALDRSTYQDEALRNLARLKTLHEDWDSAIQLWAEVAKKTPEDPWPLVQKARAVAKIKSTEDARQNWLTLLEKHPDHVEALTCLGRIEMVEKNWETASGYWQQLKQVAPHLTEPAIQLSRIHLAHKDDAQAESALSDILTLQPDHPEALSNLSRLYFRTDREEQGFAICEEWAKSNADDLRPLLILARAHHANGDLPPAKREAGWQRVLARAPNHLEALTGLARLLQARQDYSTALSLWEKLCDLDETKAVAWTNRVRILDKTDQPELIPPLLKQVRTLFGTSVEDLLSKAEISEAARSFEDARLYLQEACASYPDDVLPHKRYGNFLLSQGELTTSLNAYRTARELDPYDTQIASALVQIVSSLELVGQDITPYWQTGSTQPLLRTPEIFYPKIAEIAHARRPKTSKKSQKHTVVMVTGSLGPGGAERQLVATAIALKEQTDQVAHVTVLVRSLNDHDRSAFFLPHLEEAGIPVHEYGPSRADTEECAYVKDCPEVELLRAFPQNMNKSLVKLYRLFKELAPTIVHAWQDTTAVDAATSAVLAGVEKVLLSTRSLRPDHHRRLLPYLKPAYQALLQLDGVRMTNNSRAGLLDYADWLSLPLEEGDVTPNGLDTARLQKERQAADSQKIKQQLNIPADAPVFGGVMRFTEEKRPLLWVQTMAKVAEKIPNAHFVLVGDGPMRPQAQALCHTLGLAERAHLVGTDRDVVPWYSLMDMLLLTSRVEGCPNVLLEAQCLGIPVVAPKVGGAPETVDDTQTGWIVPADHPDLSSALAERLIYSQQNQPWYLNAQKRAPHFIENTFGLKASLASTLRAFEF
ncbi:glycosyltransferase [Terasakiella pusilla]|uniref:glycosyltransferase n=1 Tax=Terasakiella pusilla TaxID=64973 RepID=UPI003AA84DB6